MGYLDIVRDYFNRWKGCIKKIKTVLPYFRDYRDDEITAVLQKEKKILRRSKATLPRITLFGL